MDFFTYRFLYGASVLSRDIQQRSWVRRKTLNSPEQSRWNAAAALLLKGSCGARITPKIAARAGPFFRNILSANPAAARSAQVAYVTALEYLSQRGFGSIERKDACPTTLPQLLKKHHVFLPESCKRHLADTGIHLLTFGLHLPEESAQPGGICPGPVEETEIGATATSRGYSPSSRDVLPQDTEAESIRQEDDEEEEEEDWTVLVNKPAPGMPNTYAALRKWMERALGQAKDTGIYDYKEKRAGALRRVMTAACKAGACEACSKRIKAVLTVSWDGGTQVWLGAKGKHGTLHQPDGGLLWSVGEMYAIMQHATQNPNLGAKDVRKALQDAGFAVRCTSEQLVQWAAQGRVCAMWTCAGMVQRGRGACNKVVKLVVDGKQQIVSNDYTILTLSFLVPSETVSKTWVGKSHTASAELHIATQQPFVQALLNTEAEGNVLDVFNAACELGQRYCELDLRSQVLQVHKDFAKGIENARRRAFPASRPCDDYAHMRRASYNKLKQLLGVKPKLPGAQSERKDDGDETRELNSKAAANFRHLDKIVQLSRHLPTLQFFDAVWHLALQWLESCSKQTFKYWTDTYFDKIPATAL
ncbi:unnamed protein product [Symbiodinium necroappetens]|uniref:Uncharacterized protein n=1 Tax=Symbiodinium necroappetens TaxID=1628268 RepID=A0A812NT34_9DINO|nr:unnamed protein product [Symbiodinium necroappetens]